MTSTSESVVYFDPTVGRSISTHSMLKTFSRCPRQAYYKYVLRLKPRVMSAPLHRGVWIHACLEEHYRGGDWRTAHAKFVKHYNKLFDEERDKLGPLPEEIERLLKSYFWYYKNDRWKVHDVEFTLEAALPDGSLYRAKIDLLVENEWGLWIVDHKSHRTLPGLDFRILDAQSAKYIWAALRNGIPVQGHIWNYLRYKPATIPQLAYEGTKRERLSTRAIETDYPTYKAALKKYGYLDDPRYRPVLKRLKKQRYRHGEIGTSPFFQRSILEKSPGMLDRVFAETVHTHTRMHEYPWGDTDAIERVPDRSCAFMCSYTDLCTAELMGGNTAVLLKKKYQEADPLDYYQDDRVEKEFS